MTTRLIVASDNLLDTWGTRTEDGYGIRAEWGEPDQDGHYSPTFTIDFTDDLRVTERQRTVERIRARIMTRTYTGAEVVAILDSIASDDGGAP